MNFKKIIATLVSIATGTDLAVAFYRYYEAVRAINGN